MTQDTVLLGANAKAQAICFALCFCIGLVAGIAALLYLRKGGKAERVLTDLFATALIAAGFIACIEFVLDGAPELYGAAAYVLGTAVLPLTVRAARKHALKKRNKEAANCDEKERDIP